MNQLLFYKWAFLALILLNLATLGFILSRPKPPGPIHGGDRGSAIQQEVIEILALDSEQQENFKQLAKKHQQQVIVFQTEQQAALTLYFNTILEDREPADSLIQELQQLERDKIEFTYQHFKAVKAILKEEQQADFKKFMDEIMPIVTGDKKKRRPPPTGF